MILSSLAWDKWLWVLTEQRHYTHLWWYAWPIHAYHSNLELGFQYYFGNKVSIGQVSADYLLPLLLVMPISNLVRVVYVNYETTRVSLGPKSLNRDRNVWGSSCLRGSRGRVGLNLPGRRIVSVLKFRNALWRRSGTFSLQQGCSKRKNRDTICSATY